MSACSDHPIAARDRSRRGLPPRRWRRRCRSRPRDSRAPVASGRDATAGRTRGARPRRRSDSRARVGNPKRWPRRSLRRRRRAGESAAAHRARRPLPWSRSPGSRRVRIDEMTSEDFAAIGKKDPVVILPVGALEEHGRHLPLGADVIQPLHVVDAVARRTNAYVAPAIPYGVCTTTRRYPGTVSVSVDALKGFVRDVLADFVRNGVRRVMILSGHAGREHMMALRAAAQEVVDEGTGLRATVLSDYDIIYASQGILPEGDGHAGAGETSRIMTARPDLVKGKSPAGKNEIPPYAIVSDPRKYWSGVTGDPSKASKALGEKLDDLVIGELVKLVEELRRRA